MVCTSVSNVSARMLANMGWEVWLDEDQLTRGGDIGVGMARGIDKSDAVIIFLSEAYMKKVNTGNMKDNVYKEFNYTIFRSKRVVPVVMEPLLLELKNWPHGLSAMHLCGQMFVDGATGSLLDVSARIHERLLCEEGMKPKKISPRIFRRRTRRNASSLRHIIQL